MEEANNLQLKYEERLNISSQKINFYKRQMAITSWLRVLVFGLVIFTFYAIFKYNFIIGWFLLFAEVSVFLILLKRFAKFKQHHRFWSHIKVLNDNEIKGLNYQYSQFEDGEEFKDISHGYSFDLDLFGKASIFQYINRTSTPMGKEKLASSLLNIELNAAKVEELQEAVKELTPLLEWRQEFLAFCGLAQIKPGSINGILHWVENEDVYSKIKYLKTMLILSPIFFGIIVLGTILDFISASFAILFFLIPLIISGRYIKQTNKEQEIIDNKLGFLKELKTILQFIEETPFKSAHLQNLKYQLVEEHKVASASIHQLSKHVDMLLARNNMVVGILLNMAALWDLRYMFKINMWKRVYGKHIKNWLQQVGEMEKLVCFANFAFNNPANTYPSFLEKKENILEATALGHPLLPAKQRINNDYKLNLPKQFTIITGANMAGKSTFLRAVGVNYLLAQTGAPVCATQFKIRLMPMLTSMRTSDSLYENKSYFHSELLRLKFILDQLKEKGEAFVILDEILKGTNFKDQSVGARALLDNLLTLGGCGIVATHDLSLCDIDKEFPQAVENFSFNVSFVEGGLEFNYKLQPGICKQMNATYLMKSMGIIDSAYIS